MTSIIQRLSRSGAKFAYRAQGAGEPLVLVHGVGMCSAAWAPQIDALSDQYHVVALDLPGHGQSDALPGAPELQDFVAWCHDAIETLGLGPVNLAGHSMGALIALGCAVSHPDLIRRVAVLSCVHRRDPTARMAVMARAAAIKASGIDVETPLKRWFGDTPAEHAARQQVAGWLAAMDVPGYAAAYSAFANGDVTYADDLTQIACQLLALTGDGDPNSTPAMTHAIADEVQDGTAVVIGGHRHMVNLTAADQVTDHLRRWLAHPATTASKSYATDKILRGGSI